MTTPTVTATPCPAGGDKFVHFYSAATQRQLLQYDYRTWDGKLFSCVAANIFDARERRDAWLRGQAERRK